MSIVCDVCGSDQIASQNEGFNFTKAVIGDVLSGPALGVYLGGRNQHKIILTCLNCGNTWKPKERYKRQNRPQNSGGGGGPLAGLGTLLFWLGVLLMPYLFSWFTLRNSHGTAARVVAFGWLLSLVAVGVVGSILPDPDHPANQKAARPATNQPIFTASASRPSPTASIPPPDAASTASGSKSTGQGLPDPANVAPPPNFGSNGIVDEPNYSPAFRDCLAQYTADNTFMTACIKPELKDQSLKLKLQYEQLLASLDFGHQMHLRASEGQWEETLRSRCGFQDNGSDIQAVTDDQAACELPAVAQRRLDLKKVDQ